MSNPFIKPEKWWESCQMWRKRDKERQVFREFVSDFNVIGMRQTGTWESRPINSHYRAVLDHTSEARLSDGRRVFISQPYDVDMSRINERTFAKADRTWKGFCASNRLEHICSEDKYSWHFPEHTRLYMAEMTMCIFPTRWPFVGFKVWPPGGPGTPNVTNQRMEDRACIICGNIFKVYTFRTGWRDDHGKYCGKDCQVWTRRIRRNRQRTPEIMALRRKMGDRIFDLPNDLAWQHDPLLPALKSLFGDA